MGWLLGPRALPQGGPGEAHELPRERQTRWWRAFLKTQYLKTTFCKMCTSLARQAHGGQKRPPTERQSRGWAAFFVVALNVALGSPPKGGGAHPHVFRRFFQTKVGCSQNRKNKPATNHVFYEAKRPSGQKWRTRRFGFYFVQQPFGMFLVSVGHANPHSSAAFCFIWQNS